MADVETTDAIDVEDVEQQDEAQEPDEQEEDPTAGLKRALQSERQQRRAAEKRAREFESQAKAKDLEPAEQAIEQARREAREQAESAAKQKLLHVKVQASAKGRLSDPTDALKFLDLEAFELSDDDGITTAEIEQAIDDLLKARPYLAAEPARRFQQSADQGAKGHNGPTQVTRDQLTKMTPDQVVKAKADGRLDDLLGVKN